MTVPRIAVIGAGIGGLTAAVDLARSGADVVVLERAPAPGGKMREILIAGHALDAGPTVFTLRRVFDRLFADAGDDFERRVDLVPATLLARHAWSESERLDLFADVKRSAEAIGVFAGAAEARGFERFAAQAQRVYTTLERTFMQASRPSPLGLVRRVGIAGLADLWNIKPFASLWRTVSQCFRDPRLRQLFGRYATYCGSSPFSAPATLMLVAHVEQSGVWYVNGGMHRLAAELAALAARRGAAIRYGTPVREIILRGGRVSAVETEGGERIEVDAVVCNADNDAVAGGLFGRGVMRAARPTPAAERSLSAVTWNLRAHTEGFELAHHSVFFSADYRAEFDDIFRRRQLPTLPTVYLCAQDRRDAAPLPDTLSERLLCLINAPPTGDTHVFTAAEIESCERRMFRRLTTFGLRIERRDDAVIATSPSDFHRLYPGTGGALYGPASHGWRASFRRADSRSSIPGLYLAGGSIHPGPGVPMAAVSGRLAAAACMADCASTRRFPEMAMPGGTSMP